VLTTVLLIKVALVAAGIGGLVRIVHTSRSGAAASIDRSRYVAILLAFIAFLAWLIVSTETTVRWLGTPLIVIAIALAATFFVLSVVAGWREGGP
jgi:hypothetical protein